jgi:hypothetical protein
MARTSLRIAIMVILTITAHITSAQLLEACLGSLGGPANWHRSSTLLESVSDGPILLRPEGVRSALRPMQGFAGAAPGEVLRRAVASRRLMLLLCNLRAEQTPETLFHVYLNLPEQADRAMRARHLLAQFNFFEATQPGEATTPVWQSIDVTQAIGALVEQGMLVTEATLTILAAQRFDPKSRPSVGRIAIVQQ